jgi:predicted anti-sigma-YlaC factor YlaD
MNCGEAKKRMLSGDVPDQEDLDRHIAGCSLCREDRSVIQSINAVFHEESLRADAVLPPPAFEARFWARVSREKERKSTLRGWSWGGLGAAAAAACGVLVWTFSTPRPAAKVASPNGGAASLLTASLSEARDCDERERVDRLMKGFVERTI